MNRTAFNYTLGVLTRTDKQVLDRIGGSLRSEGMVSVGGRGLNAPELTPMDAANIVLGLLSTDNASGAAKKVKDVSQWQSPKGEKLGDAIATIFSSPEIARKVSYISIYRNFPEATIGWSTMDPDVLYTDEPTPVKEVFTPKGEQSDSPGFYIEAILTGGVIRTIVRTLHEIEKTQVIQ